MQMIHHPFHSGSRAVQNGAVCGKPQVPFCWACSLILHQRSVEGGDLLHAGVPGVAGTAGVGVGGLSQELHILLLGDLL